MTFRSPSSFSSTSSSSSSSLNTNTVPLDAAESHTTSLPDHYSSSSSYNESTPHHGVPRSRNFNYPTTTTTAQTQKQASGGLNEMTPGGGGLQNFTSHHLPSVGNARGIQTNHTSQQQDTAEQYHRRQFSSSNDSSGANVPLYQVPGSEFMLLNSQRQRGADAVSNENNNNNRRRTVEDTKGSSSCYQSPGILNSSPPVTTAAHQQDNYTINAENHNMHTQGDLPQEHYNYNSIAGYDSSLDETFEEEDDDASITTASTSRNGGSRENSIGASLDELGSEEFVLHSTYRDESDDGNHSSGIAISDAAVFREESQSQEIANQRNDALASMHNSAPLLSNVTNQQSDSSHQPTHAAPATEPTKKKKALLKKKTCIHIGGSVYDIKTIAFPALSIHVILYIKRDTPKKRSTRKSKSSPALNELSSKSLPSLTPSQQILVAIKNISRHLIEIKAASSIYSDEQNVELLNKMNHNIHTAEKSESPSAPFSSIPVLNPSQITTSFAAGGSKKKAAKKEIEIASHEKKIIYVYEPTTKNSKKGTSPKSPTASLQELHEMLHLVVQDKEETALVPLLLSSLRLKVKCIQSNRLSRYCQHLLAHSITQKTAFTDHIFPPTNKSISLHGEASSGYNTKWMRPREFLRNQNVTLFSTSDDDPSEKKIHVAHIYQGKLGNCYLLSAIVALTRHHPRLIHKLFTTKTFNKCGIYEIRFCFCGEYKKVQVDDFIPVNDDGNRAKYVHSHHPVIWPALLEKAYAKLYGSFLTLKRGKSENALTDLTGMPSKRIEFKRISKSVKSGEFFFEILRYTEKKYPICTSTIALLDKKKTGLGSAHAYTLIHARIYTDPNTEQEYRLVCLRDPRGSLTCKLPYSPRDEIWKSNPEMYEHFYHDSSHETEFWMTYKDYVRHFNRLSVCFVKDWKEKRARILCNNGEANAFYLTTYEPDTAVYIMLHQLDKRVKNARGYIPVCALVTNSRGTKYLFDTNFESKRTVRHAKHVFEKPDTYAIIPLTTYQGTRSVVLSVHSEKDIKLAPQKPKFSIGKAISLPALMKQNIQKTGWSHRSKKISGCVVELWKKKVNRDVLYGFKLKKLSKKLTSLDMEYRVTLKNMDVVCGKESGVVTLTTEEDFAFLIRFCATGKTTYHKIDWEQKGKLGDKRGKSSKGGKKKSK